MEGPRSALIRSALIAILLLAGLLIAPQIGGQSATERRACPPGYQRFSEGEAKARGLCINDKHPEDPRELAASGAQQYAIQAAPGKTVPRNAYIRAIRRRSHILKHGQSPPNRHRWQPYGIGPLQAQDKAYSSVNGLGLVELAGRITD